MSAFDDEVEQDLLATLAELGVTATLQLVAGGVLVSSYAVVSTPPFAPKSERTESGQASRGEAQAIIANVAPVVGEVRPGWRLVLAGRTWVISEVESIRAQERIVATRLVLD